MTTFGLVLAILWLIPITIVLICAAVTPVKSISAAKNTGLGLVLLLAAATTAAGAGAAITAAFAINSGGL